MWVGIFANLALAIPTIAAPAALIGMMGWPTATPDLWPRFSALLLVLLSVFYMPAGLDIDRYRATAWFAVASRLAGVLFFMFEPTYWFCMVFDGVFLVPLAILLTMAVRGEKPAAAPATAPEERRQAVPGDPEERRQAVPGDKGAATV
jgi:hypothetical protein